jgi:hypothetical protein
VVAGLLLLVACGSERPGSEPSQRGLLYAEVLHALHHEAGQPDTLFLDRRPRLLVHEEPLRVRMGEFNRYGDPALSAAIDQGPAYSPCELEPLGSCRRAAHPTVAVVSEYLPLGNREAVVLASFTTPTGRGVVSRDLFFQLRFRRGAWRVTQVGEGDVVALSRGAAGGTE